MDRRGFLIGAALSGAALLLPGSVSGQADPDIRVELPEGRVTDIHGLVINGSLSTFPNESHQYQSAFVIAGALSGDTEVVLPHLTQTRPDDSFTTGDYYLTMSLVRALVVDIRNQGYAAFRPVFEFAANKPPILIPGDEHQRYIAGNETVIQGHIVKTRDGGVQVYYPQGFDSKLRGISLEKNPYLGVAYAPEKRILSPYQHADSPSNAGTKEVTPVNFYKNISSVSFVTGVDSIGSEMPVVANFMVELPEKPFVLQGGEALNPAITYYAIDPQMIAVSLEYPDTFEHKPYNAAKYLQTIIRRNPDKIEKIMISRPKNYTALSGQVLNQPELQSAYNQVLVTVYDRDAFSDENAQEFFKRLAITNIDLAIIAIEPKEGQELDLRDPFTTEDKEDHKVYISLTRR
jgi:hypothetical protein